MAVNNSRVYTVLFTSAAERNTYSYKESIITIAYQSSHVMKRICGADMISLRFCALFNL